MKTTSQRILDAATLVFARAGVTGATTREIAREAKVNEVTLFRHFKNKEELLHQVVLQFSLHFEELFTEASFETPADLRRTVHAFATTYSKMLYDNQDFIRTFFGEMHRHQDLCKRLFVDSSKSSRQRLIDYLKAAQKAGLVGKKVHIDTAADALTGMLLHGMLKRPMTESKYTVERYLKTCLELFLKGIEP